MVTTSTVVFPKMFCPVLMSLLTQPDRFVKLNAEKAPFFVEKLAASGLSEIKWKTMSRSVCQTHEVEWRYNVSALRGKLVLKRIDPMYACMCVSVHYEIINDNSNS